MIQNRNKKAVQGKAIKLRCYLWKVFGYCKNFNTVKSKRLHRLIKIDNLFVAANTLFHLAAGSVLHNAWIILQATSLYSKCGTTNNLLKLVTSVIPFMKQTLILLRITTKENYNVNKN